MSATDGRVLYAGFPTRRPSGGVAVQLAHVALLVAHGIDARLWLPAPTSGPTDQIDAQGRPRWFPPQVPVCVADTLALTQDDLLVVPEVPWIPGADPAPGSRKVIFNQNHFFTFAAAPESRQPYPGFSPPPAVWTVSRESREVLAALHPELPVRLIPSPLDGDRFRPLPADGPRIAWVNRKRPHEADLLRRLLAGHPRLDGVGLDEIVDVTPAEMARTLGRATIFLSLGHSEGFGLPVAEALAAGCLVVGYDGGGGHELFRAPGAWRVPEQRPLLLLQQVVELLDRADELAPLAAANRTWVLERYHPAVTQAALLDAVNEARARPSAAAIAIHPAAHLPALPAGFTLFG